MRQAPGDSADHRRLSLKDFNTSDIRAMLAGRSAPLSEAEILRLLTGGKALPREREALFELHFSLYHALYRLKAEAGRRGFYIHLDPMRIRMVRTPDGAAIICRMRGHTADCGATTAATATFMRGARWTSMPRLSIRSTTSTLIPITFLSARADC